MDREIIEGEKLILRPVTGADTPDIVRWRNNPRVRRGFVYRETFTPEIHENWLREKVATGRVHQFIILEKENRRPIGSVYLRDIDTVGGTAEYGIFIGEDDATGRGYAIEAAELMVGYARTIQGLRKLGLRVFADNEAAVRSYLSAGYEKIRTLSGVECSDGECKDMIWMEQRL